MNEALSTKEICAAIKKDLKLRRITHEMAAEKIGCKKQTFSNLLTGNRRISANMATKLFNAFGYSTEFLTFGTGELYAPGHVVWAIKGNSVYMLGRDNDPVLQQGYLAQAAAKIIRIMNNKVAIRCFDSYVNNDMEQYKECLDILIHDFYGDLPLYGQPPKVKEALLNMRDWFTEMELASAKELIRIENDCLHGKKIAIDEEMKRFKTKLLRLQRMHEILPAQKNKSNKE